MVTGLLITLLFIGVVLLALTNAPGEHETAGDRAARGYLQCGAAVIVGSSAFTLLFLHVPWQAVVVGVVALVVAVGVLVLLALVEGMSR